MWSEVVQPDLAAGCEGPLPALGGRFARVRLSRFIPEASDDGWAVNGIAKAPSRGEGRARPGAGRPVPSGLRCHAILALIPSRQSTRHLNADFGRPPT